MAGWKDNAIMFWASTKVSDHGRSPLSMTSERIGNDVRTANGTLRRHHVAKKRSWSVSWEMIPSTNAVGGLNTVDDGMSGEEIEEFYNDNDGSFRLILRRGSAVDTAAPTPAESALPYEDADFYICNVMFKSFSKETVKRGPVTDYWSIDVTLEEV